MMIANLGLAAALCVLLGACGSVQSEEWVDPDYEHLVGKSFSNSIYKGRTAFTKIGEVDGIEVYRDSRRDDGCVLTFGVKKADDTIKYWRIDSGPGTCRLTKRTSHINQ
jgi:hypothetical protein